MTIKEIGKYYTKGTCKKHGNVKVISFRESRKGKLYWVCEKCFDGLCTDSPANPQKLNNNSDNSPD